MASGSVISLLPQGNNLGQGIHGYKSGNMVFLTFEPYTAKAFNANATIITLPEGWRPIEQVSFWSTVKNCRVVIDATGKVYCTVALTASDTLRGTVSYMIP